jgi:hypothetical protein
MAAVREITIPYSPRDAFKPFHDRDVYKDQMKSKK